MPRIPGWMVPILGAHPTRKWKPVRDSLRAFAKSRRLSNHAVKYESRYLVTLFNKIPEARDRLQVMGDVIKEARPRGPIYAPKGNHTEYMRAIAARTKYLHTLLAKHPTVLRRFLSYLSKRHLESSSGTQITFAGRHIGNDRTLFSLLRRTELKPTSFLEVGAAFESLDFRGEWSDDLAPVRESKEFFDGKGIEMKYTAADIIPISRQEQNRYRERGITAIRWDYRERPLTQARRKVKQFSVIRMANVSRHQTRGEFKKTVSVLLRSLEPDGILTIKNDGDGLNDEAFYQKQKKRGRWTLVQIQSKK